MIQRVGREAVLEEAVRDTLSSWYSDAIESAGIVPVGDPQLDLGELPAQGQALEFSIEIGVLPKAKLGEYKGLEVARREPDGRRRADRAGDRGHARASGAAGDGRAARRARATSSSSTTSARLAERGPEGETETEPRWEAFAGGEGRDQLVELGAGKLIPGFEEGLAGGGRGRARARSR